MNNVKLPNFFWWSDIGYIPLVPTPGVGLQPGRLGTRWLLLHVGGALRGVSCPEIGLTILQLVKITPITLIYECLWYFTGVYQLGFMHVYDTYIYITWLHRVIGFINVYQPPHDWPQLCGHFWSNPRRCQVELPLGQAKGTGGHWDRSIHSFNGNSRILKRRLHRPYIWIYMVGTSNQSDPGVAIDSYGKTSIKPLSFLGFSR